MTSLYNVSQCDLSRYTSICSDILIKIDSFINEVCLPACPSECNRTLYETSISSVQLIGNQWISYITNNPKLYSDFINRTVDSIQAEKSIVNVNLFYSDLSYTITTESPEVEWVSLFGIFLEQCTI